MDLRSDSKTMSGVRPHFLFRVLCGSLILFRIGEACCRVLRYRSVRHVSVSGVMESVGLYVVSLQCVLLLSVVDGGCHLTHMCVAGVVAVWSSGIDVSADPG